MTSASQYHLIDCAIEDCEEITNAFSTKTRMGIQGLTKVIADNAPEAIKEGAINAFFGRKVAIDASMSIYQFLIAVRQSDGNQLMNEQGETTRHAADVGTN